MNNLPFGVDALVPGFPKLPSADAKKDPFELGAGPFLSQELRVISFHGHERINDTFVYDVTFASEVPAELLYPGVDGEPASLTIKAPGHEPRIIQGIVSAFEPLGHVPGQHGSNLLLYNLEIVPKLWLLKHQTRNRAFQDRTPRQIIEEILADSNIGPEDCHWRIRASDYRPLPFVLQRDESDYDFFRRVLADAGIFFYFEHASGLLDTLLPGAGGIANAAGSVADLLGGPAASTMGALGAASKMLTILNFGDEPGHTPAVAAMAVVNQAIGDGFRKVASEIGGDDAAQFVDEEPCDTIAFDDGHAAHTDQERIHAFGLKKQIRPKSVRLLDRDVEGSSSWQASTETKPVNPSAKLKVGLSMGANGPSLKANANLGLDIDSPTIKATQLREDYYQLDAQLRAYSNRKQRVDRELERMRRDYLSGHGESDCRRLGAGYRFRLGGHPVGGLNLEYTVTELVSDGVQPDFASENQPVYRNRFECIPSSAAPRPARPEKRPKLGLEIATVIDSGGADVSPYLQTNGAGYVRVRFRWDVYDEPRMRDGIVMQPGADPDSHTTIWVPVLHSWGGNGYGCQFIPREGMEVLIGFLGGQGERPVVLGCLYSEQNGLPFGNPIKHQKVGIVTRTRPRDGNWSEVSLDDQQGAEVLKFRAARDMDEEVLHDRMSTVGNDRSGHVGGSDWLAVEKDRAVSVGADAVESIARDRSVTVGGSLRDSVSGTRTFSTTGNVTDIVLGDRTEHTGRKWEQNAGSLALTVEGDNSNSVRGAYRQTVGEPGAEASSDAFIYGDYSVNASGSVHIEGASVVLQAKGTRLELTESKLAAFAKLIDASADSTNVRGNNVHITAKKACELRAQTVRAMSSGALLELDSKATLDAPTVHLASGGSSSEEQAELARDPRAVLFTTRLVDDAGNAVANAKYHLYYGGSRFEGTTTGEGGVQQLLVPSLGARVHLRVWAGEFPTSKPREYDLHWWDPVPPMGSDLGILLRLRNLGHFSGAIPKDDPEYLATLRRDALLDFMRLRMPPNKQHFPENENDALAHLLKLHGH